VKMGMNARKASAEDNIRLLEKLSDLKEAGIISEREFKEKKKKILEKI
ncbi:MAG: SHOCT domain-containing protein, partial [Nitrosarchaeum sp.]|nr:SHOCT domain-containing protein [Nitrosarchaeum sp.]